MKIEHNKGLIPKKIETIGVLDRSNLTSIRSQEGGDVQSTSELQNISGFPIFNDDDDVLSEEEIQSCMYKTGGKRLLNKITIENDDNVQVFFLKFKEGATLTLIKKFYIQEGLGTMHIQGGKQRIMVIQANDIAAVLMMGFETLEKIELPKLLHLIFTKIEPRRYTTKRIRNYFSISLMHQYNKEFLESLHAIRDDTKAFIGGSLPNPFCNDFLFLKLKAMRECCQIDPLQAYHTNHENETLEKISEVEKKHIINDVQRIEAFAKNYGDIVNVKKIELFFQKKYVTGYNYIRKNNICRKITAAIQQQQEAFSQYTTRISNENEVTGYVYDDKYTTQNLQKPNFSYEFGGKVYNVTPYYYDNVDFNQKHLHIDTTWVDKNAIVGIMSLNNNKNQLVRAYLITNDQPIRETRAMYDSILKDLRKSYTKLESITGDFSNSLIGATGQNPKSLKFWGCYFHYKQAITSKMSHYKPSDRIRKYAELLPFIEKCHQTPQLIAHRKIIELGMTKIEKQFICYIKTQFLKKSPKRFQNIITVPEYGYISAFGRLTNSHLENRFGRLKKILKKKKSRKRIAEGIALLLEQQNQTDLLPDVQRSGVQTYYMHIRRIVKGIAFKRYQELHLSEYDDIFKQFIICIMKRQVSESEQEELICMCQQIKMDSLDTKHKIGTLLAQHTVAIKSKPIRRLVKLLILLVAQIIAVLVIKLTQIDQQMSVQIQDDDEENFFNSLWNNNYTMSVNDEKDTQQVLGSISEIKTSKIQKKIKKERKKGSKLLKRGPKVNNRAFEISLISALKGKQSRKGVLTTARDLKTRKYPKMKLSFSKGWLDKFIKRNKILINQQ